MSDDLLRTGSEPSLGGAARDLHDAQLGGDAGLLHLIEYLHDPDPALRQRAVVLLGERGNVQAYDELVRIYREGDPSLHEPALISLGKVRDPRAADLLLHVFTDRQADPKHRQAAALALGYLGHEPTVRARITAALLAPLQDFSEDRMDVRVKVVDALGILGNPEAIPVLRRLALHTEYTPIWTAYFVKGAVNALQTLEGEDFVQDLLALARKGGQRAAYALGWLKDPRAVPVLTDLLDTTSLLNYNLIDTIVRAFSLTRLPECVPPLLSLLERLQGTRVFGHRLNDPLSVKRNQGLCASAVSGLGKIGDSRAAEPIIVVLRYAQSHGLENLEIDCVEAMGKIGDSRALDAIIALLGDIPEEGSVSLKNACLGALGQLRDPRAVPIIVSYLGRGQPAIEASTVVAALKDIGTAETIEPLLAIYQRSDTGLTSRLIILEALGPLYFSDARIPALFISSLAEGSAAEQRIKAAGWLGHHREFRAVDGLADMLGSSNVSEQQAARLALAQIDTADARAALAQST